ncbi:MAG TPA: rhodanese-like domain-containing protein [Acidimicrobiales bacterium]|nr:rhodanese-like domain-containing protein [Acidimicrobiales bacterium]
MSLLHRRLRRPYAEVGPARAHQVLEAGAVLVDVRERQEWNAGHAPQATHIPLGQLERRLDDLPEGRALVTVCRSGQRSARAAALLGRHGREVSNLAGGMHAWARAGLPVVAGGGGPGRVA